MLIGGYEFIGPSSDTDSLLNEQGVYVVVCMVRNVPHCILDIGTAEKERLRDRILSHDRKSCWGDHSHGGMAYAAMYMKKDERRLEIEDELRWKYDPPCGANAWDTNPDLTKIMQQRFGSEGSLRDSLNSLS